MIRFDWPHKDLSPNARVHWSKKSKAAKKYKSDCYYIAKEAKLTADWAGKINLYLTFCPPHNRLYDADNAIASIKSGLDGLALALGVNDTRFVLKTVVMTYQPPKVGVFITLGP